MKLTSDQVKHVAKLANLPISDEENQKYSATLSKILDYIEQLNQVDTSTVGSLFSVSDLSNVMRLDESSPGLSQEGALQNAPSKKDGLIASKEVVFGG